MLPGRMPAPTFPSPERFTPHVGSDFTLLRRGGRPLLLRLEAVRASPFVLVFSAGERVVLPPVTYLRHEALGQLAVALLSMPDVDGRARYEARPG